MPKSALRAPVQTKNSFEILAQEESKPKKTVKVTEPRGTKAQGASGSIGERPGPSPRKPKFLTTTIGQIRESIGAVEGISIVGECAVVEETVERLECVIGLFAFARNCTQHHARHTADRQVAMPSWAHGPQK